MSFNIELDSKPDHTGFTAVMVRLHLKGCKPARVLTAVKIESKYWAGLDKKRKAANLKPEWGKWVLRHTDATSLNASIEREYNRIKGQVEIWQAEHAGSGPDSGLLTPRQLADKFKTRLSESYFDLTAQALEKAKALSFRTYSNRQSAVHCFAEYAGDDLTLQAVTVPYVEGWQDYLKTRYVSPRTKKRLAASSINQYLEILNTVHVEVLRLKGHTRKKAALLSPFSDVEQLKTKSAYRGKFDEAAIGAIQLNFPDSRRRRIPPEEGFSIWMLSHFLAGARVGDVLALRYFHFQTDEHGLPIHVSYTMSKTGNVVSLPILDEARVLLGRWWQMGATPTDYLLPYLDSQADYARYLTRDELYEAPFAVRRQLSIKKHYWNQHINAVLAEIETSAGLKHKLRMHNARHSFADLARRIMQEDGTLSILDITRMLGQTDYRMVMTYIEDMEKQDSTKSMGAVFNRKKKAPAEVEG